MIIDCSHSALIPTRNSTVFSTGQKGLASPGNGKQARRNCQVLKNSLQKDSRSQRTHYVYYMIWNLNHSLPTLFSFNRCI